MPADGTGKKVQSWDNLIGTDQVHTQAATLTTSAGVEIAPATGAKQDTGNASLANVDGKLPATIGQKAMAASLAVTLASDQSDVPTTAKAATVPAATTLQNAAVANGNGAAVTVTGYASMVISVVSSPAMSGGTTVNFEASTDGTTFVPISAVNIGSTVLTSTTTADGDFRFNVSSYLQVRARISAYSAGTVTVKAYPTPTGSQATVIALAAGSNTIGALTANQSINNAQINGVTPLMGAGATGTGSQRVTIASANATIYNNKKTVTTAGTRVTLNASQAVSGVTITALVTNTDLIFVGNATVASTNGIQLRPGGSVTLDIQNLNTVNLDSVVSGEGVTFIATGV